MVLSDTSEVELEPNLTQFCPPTANENRWGRMHLVNCDLFFSAYVSYFHHMESNAFCHTTIRSYSQFKQKKY